MSVAFLNGSLMKTSPSLALCRLQNFDPNLRYKLPSKPGMRSQLKRQNSFNYGLRENWKLLKVNRGCKTSAPHKELRLHEKVGFMTRQSSVKHSLPSVVLHPKLKSLLLLLLALNLFHSLERAEYIVEQARISRGKLSRL